jgi:hypothetical protein
MNVKKNLQQLIRGWLPKEPNVTRAYFKMQSAKGAVLALGIFFVAVLLFVLTLGAGWVARFGFLIFFVAAILVVGLIFRKDRKNGELAPLPKVRRVRIMVCSGLFTAFVVGTGLRVMLGPLPSYFWVIFLGLIAVGAFVGDQIWKTQQKHN